MTLTRVEPSGEDASARKSVESLSPAARRDAREPSRGAKAKAHSTNAAEADNSHPRRRLCFRDFKGSSTTDFGPNGVLKFPEGLSGRLTDSCLTSKARSSPRAGRTATRNLRA